MTPLTLRIIGIPKPQARPRVFQAGGRTISWSPKTSWYALVYAKALENRPAVPLDAPLSVEVEFIMPRPKARKKEVWHTTRPDWDNLLKGCQDAMTQAQWWRDDSLIAKALMVKRYQSKDEPTGAIINVSVLP